MPLEYEQQFTTLNYECDAWGRMTPGAALRRIQEISVEHSDSVGVGDEVYSRTGALFLLSRVSLAMHRMPGIGEAVRLQTRAWGMKRAVFHRMTGLYGANGALLCEADARWLLVDMENKRILRRVPEGFPMPFTDLDTTGEHDVKLPKLEAEALHPLGSAKAAYTLCDSNGHINNTRYADLVADALPLAVFEKGGPARMLLVYHHEIPLGASMELYAAETAQGHYFAARQEASNSFEAFTWL